MNISRCIYYFLFVAIISLSGGVVIAQTDDGKDKKCERTQVQKNYDKCIADNMASAEYKNLIKRRNVASEELTAKKKEVLKSGQKVTLSRDGYGAGGVEWKEFDVDLVNAATWCQKYPKITNFKVDGCDAITGNLKEILDELISLNKSYSYWDKKTNDTFKKYEKSCVASECINKDTDVNQCDADDKASKCTHRFNQELSSLKSADTPCFFKEPTQDLRNLIKENKQPESHNTPTIIPKTIPEKIKSIFERAFTPVRQ